MGNDIQLVYYYIDLAIRRVLIWVVPAAVLFALGSAYVMTLPREYFSEAIILVRSQQMPTSLVESTVAAERLQFIEQRVLGRDNLLKIVDKFDLFTELKSRLSRTELAQLAREQITINMRASESSDPSRSSSSIFGIGVTAEEPQLSADMASEIVAMFIEENSRARMSRATETTEFLDREVRALSDRLIEHDARLAEFVSVNENALPSRLPLHLGDIREYQNQLAELERTIAENRTNILLLRSELEINTSQSDITLRNMHEQLQALRRTLVERSSVLSAEHPEIRSLRQRISRLEAEINEASARPREDAPSETAFRTPELTLLAERLEAAEQREQSLLSRQDSISERLEALREIVAAMPNIEAEFAHLQRERDSAQTALEDMTGRLNVARLGQRLETDQQSDQIQILETAEAPTHPRSARRSQYLIAVLVASLGIGFGFLILADMTDRTIRGVFDIAPVMGETPMVIVPNWKPGSGRRRQAVTAMLIVSLFVAGIVAAAGYLGFNEVQMLALLQPAG